MSTHNRLNFIYRVYVHFGIAVTITSTNHSEQPLFNYIFEICRNFFRLPDFPKFVEQLDVAQNAWWKTWPNVHRYTPYILTLWQ